MIYVNVAADELESGAQTHHWRDEDFELCIIRNWSLAEPIISDTDIKRITVPNPARLPILL